MLTKILKKAVTRIIINDLKLNGPIASAVKTSLPRHWHESEYLIWNQRQEPKDRDALPSLPGDHSEDPQ